MTTFSPHCNYISDNSIPGWIITVSIQFVDSEAWAVEFTSSWTSSQIQDEFSLVIPNYWGFTIDSLNPISLKLSEYQALNWYAEDSTWSVTPLSFTQSDCVSLPINSSITIPDSLMDMGTLKDTALVEIWLAWWVCVMLTWFIILKTLKHAIRN